MILNVDVDRTLSHLLLSMFFRSHLSGCLSGL